MLLLLLLLSPDIPDLEPAISNNVLNCAPQCSGSVRRSWVQIQLWVEVCMFSQCMRGFSPPTVQNHAHQVN